MVAEVRPNYPTEWAAMKAVVRLAADVTAAPHG
jgi:hypothetical protein